MTDNSFLPEDYLARKADRRTNIISVALFAVVMTGVFGAFLVTNQQWSHVKVEQAAINVRYQEAGKQIMQLTELEKQRDEMLHKAELASALVERVPRSILLAELINRMPPQLGLLSLEVKSERRQPAPATAPDSAGAKKPTTTRLSGANRAPTKEEAGDSLKRIEPPRYRVSLVLTGVAPTDLEVSRYLAELNAYALLREVTLDYSEQKAIEGRLMRQFRISMSLAPEADVRQVNPLQVPRSIRNPMTDEMQFPAGGPTAHGLPRN